MKKNLLAICIALILLAGCTGPAPIQGDSSTPSEEHVLPESQREASPAEPEAPTVEAPILPYEQTVASITPELAELAVQHHQKYPDTVGWLRVPGTSIDNAVVQSDDYTNEYYLQHDLDGNASRDGTYSANANCNLTGGREDISRNITLFAHNHDENPNGILFAQLKKYKDPEFARANPYIYFSTTEEDMVWEVFAVFDTVKQYNYIHATPSWFRQRRVLDMAMEASIYDYGIVPDRDDRFLTLSTCSFDIPGVGLLPLTPPNDYRFVVLARLANPGEAKKDEAAVTPRETFLLPDDIPLIDDCIYLAGWRYYLREDEFDSPTIQPLEESALVLQGTVQKTTQSDNLQDWDATFLPTGTDIYADPQYPRLLVVDHDDERLYYVPDNTRLLLTRDGEELASGALDYLTAELLWPEDAPDAEQTPERNVPPPPAGALVIVLEGRDDRHTYRYLCYLATPETVGKEVMLWQQYDGYLYKDAAIFTQLLELFPEDARL